MGKYRQQCTCGLFWSTIARFPMTHRIDRHTKRLRKSSPAAMKPVPVVSLRLTSAEKLAEHVSA
jgi:hypothetical protein